MRLIRQWPKFNKFKIAAGYYGGIGFTHPRINAGIAFDHHRNRLLCCCWKSWDEDEYRWRFNFGLNICYFYIMIMKTEIKEFYYEDRYTPEGKCIDEVAVFDYVP